MNFLLSKILKPLELWYATTKDTQEIAKVGFVLFIKNFILKHCSVHKKRTVKKQGEKSA